MVAASSTAGSATSQNFFIATLRYPSIRRARARTYDARHTRQPAGSYAHSGSAANGDPVAAIERTGQGYRVNLGNGSACTARSVVAATPAHVTATLIAGLDAALADLCGSIRYVPVVNVALAYPRTAVGHPLHGSGFVVPSRERRRVRAVSWMSSKWPGRAPDGRVLLRVSLADTGAGSMDAPDERLIERAHEDVRDLLDVRAAPSLARVYRLPKAMPQLEVGHLDRMAAIDRRLAALPGLFVTASGFRGVGLPACIADAQLVAGRVEASVAGREIFRPAGKISRSR